MRLDVPAPSLWSHPPHGLPQRVTNRLLRAPLPSEEQLLVIILGVILIILGYVLSIPILYTIGIILAVVGLILTILGAVGRGVGGRKTYF